MHYTLGHICNLMNNYINLCVLKHLQLQSKNLLFILDFQISFLHGF